MDWQLLCPSGSDGNDAESANLFRRLIMVSWTTRTIVCFSSTFGLPDVDGPQPAGSYRVDHDEESIESLSRLAWGRVSSFIYLPGIGQHWDDASDGADQSRGSRCRTRKGPEESCWIRPFFSVMPVPSATKLRRIFSRRGKLSGSRAGSVSNLNPRPPTALLPRSRREEIHNNIASETTANITNGWQRRTVLKR
jgi:hypothetical protein